MFTVETDADIVPLDFRNLNFETKKRAMGLIREFSPQEQAKILIMR